MNIFNLLFFINFNVAKKIFKKETNNYVFGIDNCNNYYSN